MHARALALSLLPIALAAPAAAGTIGGTVTDEATNAPLAGTTIVVSGPESQTAITDADGAYLVEVPSGTYLVTAFFGEQTIERANVLVEDGRADPTVSFRIDPDAAVEPWGGCVFVPPPFDNTPETDRVTDPREAALVWRRDHHGLAALDARGAAGRSTSTLDGAQRLPGAPAIALELLGDRDTAFGRPRIDRAGATGGHDALSLAHGTNDGTLGARVDVGRAGRFAGVVRGPIDEDELWASIGTVLEQRGGRLASQTALTFDAALDDEHLAELGALITSEPDGASTAWAHAGARIKGDLYRREIRMHVAAEGRAGPDPIRAAPAGLARRAAGGDGPRDVSRVSGGLTVTQRHRAWRGHHTAMVGGEIGGGDADGVAHTDVRAFAGDAWSPKPNWSLDAGLRWDRRAIGADVAEVLQPRLSVAWDPSEEGERVVFVTAERVAMLDERHLGAWRAGALHRDQAVAGLARASENRRWRWSAAAVAWALHPAEVAADRPRRAVEVVGDRGRLGVEAVARYTRGERFTADVSLSSLERAATATATVVCDDDDHRSTLAAILRATPGELAWGAAFHRRLAPDEDDDGPSFTLGLEAFAGAGAPRTVQGTLATDW